MTTDTPRRPMRPEELFDEALKLKERAERAEAEVERLRKSLDLYTDIINKQDDELIRLRTENVCLQEIIQELYEWTRRDYPTEQEVRELMNRYYDLLNK